MEQSSNRCELYELSFKNSYFEDEVREGFFVSTMMKRYWAGQLKVLAEIDRVCRKHSIRWFATYGTLIGAVRHGGYIPWDDDLDICMLRKDYERFFAIAKDELPQKFSAFTVKTEPEYEIMIGRIVNNSNVIDYGEEHMSNYFGCPYTIGVDVFPLDNLYEDEEKEEDRIRRLNDIVTAVGMIKSGEIYSDEGNKLITLIEKDNQVTLHNDAGLKRELLLLSDKIYCENESGNVAQVALMPIWARYRANKFQKNIFDHVVMLPFENTYLPVPGLYNEFLWLAYSDYMIINRGAGIHEYPVYEEQEKILGNIIGHNPFRYTFSYEDFYKATDNRKAHKDTDTLCNEMAEILYNAACHMQGKIGSGNTSDTMQLLEGSQSVAISLGTILEERVDGSAALVRLLEEYCEILYECHEGICDTGFDVLVDSISRIRKELSRCLAVRRKRVIFLPCTAKWWYTMLPYYTKLQETGAYEIIVLSLPYYEISVDGTVTLIEASGVFTKDTVVMPVTEYDFEHGYADEIVMQIPYDETNISIRVPHFFYSSNLVNYTDKLTYLPYLTPECPKSNDIKIIKSFNLLIEQPALLYADNIVLGSEEMKHIYVARMCELAGYETRDYWEAKIEVSETPRGLVDPVEYGKRRSKYRKSMPESVKQISAGRKIIMYYVDISYLLQYGADATDKMKRNIACFDEEHENICCMFVSEDRLEQIDDNDEDMKMLKSRYDEIANKISEKENYILVPYEEAERYIIDVAAYYGSAGELAHKCRLNGKPVMIIGDVNI